MLAKRAVSESGETGEQIDSWCAERVGKAKKEDVRALRRREYVPFREGEAIRVFLAVKTHPQGRAGRLRAQGGSCVSRVNS